MRHREIERDRKKKREEMGERREDKGKKGILVINY